MLEIQRVTHFCLTNINLKDDFVDFLWKFSSIAGKKSLIRFICICAFTLFTVISWWTRATLTLVGDGFLSNDYNDKGLKYRKWCTNWCTYKLTEFHEVLLFLFDCFWDLLVDHVDVDRVKDGLFILFQCLLFLHFILFLLWLERFFSFNLLNLLCLTIFSQNSAFLLSLSFLLFIS